MLVPFTLRNEFSESLCTFLGAKRKSRWLLLQLRHLISLSSIVLIKTLSIRDLGRYCSKCLSTIVQIHLLELLLHIKCRHHLLLIGINHHACIWIIIRLILLLLLKVILLRILLLPLIVLVILVVLIEVAPLIVISIVVLLLSMAMISASFLHEALLYRLSVYIIIFFSFNIIRHRHLSFLSQKLSIESLLLFIYLIIVIIVSTILKLSN